MRTYRVSRRRRLTTSNGVAADAAARRDAAVLRERLVLPQEDTRDEDSPQGQKQLETGIRCAHARSRSVSRSLSPFPLAREFPLPRISLDERERDSPLRGRTFRYSVVRLAIKFRARFRRSLNGPRPFKG